MTGRQARKVYQVPRLLDPEDPADCNYPGQCIVCHDGKGEARDIVFTGPPGPEMEPLDDEARAISKAESPKWVHPIESLATTSVDDYAQSLIAALERKSLKVPEPGNAVTREEFNAMQAQIKALLVENVKLKGKVA